MIYECNVSQVAFLFLGLLCQNVTLVSVFTLDFTRSGKSESFFSTGISLYLWHFVNNLICEYLESEAAIGSPQTI